MAGQENIQKTHWKKAFNSDYLGSCDINGNDLKLTIKEVKLEIVKGHGGVEKSCNVAHFTDDVKPMILNVTNSKTVKKFAGSRYIDDWKNIPVQIYVDPNVKMAGEITEGLRIRTQQPTAEKPALTPENKKVWANALTALREGKSISVIEDRFTLSDEDREKLLGEVDL